MNKKNIPKRRITDKTKITLTIAKFICVVIAIIGFIAMTAFKISDIENDIMINKTCNAKQDQMIEKIIEKQMIQENILIKIDTNIEWLIDNARED